MTSTNELVLLENGGTEDDQVKSSTLGRKILGLIVFCCILGLMFGLTRAGKGAEDPFWGTLTIVESAAVISVGINLIAFVPAFIFQTEKFFDLTGSLTYLSIIGYSFAAGYKSGSDEISLRSVIASSLVYVWAIRLGSFLFFRILKDGKDDRFDVLKPNFIRFMNVWTIQALWCFLTAYAVIVQNASEKESDLGFVDYIGIGIWAFGFLIEIISDKQKQWWRAQPENKGKWIEYGLWYYSRHPNYFGEVTLWLGMFILCSSSLQGTQWTAAISPVFVFLLIFFVSGVRMLEQKADKKWGHDSDYLRYKQTTSVFLILPKLGDRSKLQNPDI